MFHLTQLIVTLAAESKLWRAHAFLLCPNYKWTFAQLHYLANYWSSARLSCVCLHFLSSVRKRPFQRRLNCNRTNHTRRIAIPKWSARILRPRIARLRSRRNYFVCSKHIFADGEHVYYLRDRDFSFQSIKLNAEPAN